MPALPAEVETGADLLHAAADCLDSLDLLIMKAADVLGIISDEELVEAGVLPGQRTMQTALRELADRESSDS